MIPGIPNTKIKKKLMFSVVWQLLQVHTPWVGKSWH